MIKGGFESHRFRQPGARAVNFGKGRIDLSRFFSKLKKIFVTMPQRLYEPHCALRNGVLYKENSLKYTAFRTIVRDFDSQNHGKARG